MKRQKGFTLIELLVVIAIISVLMSILVPALSRARNQASQTWCLSNIHAMMVATRMYTDENKERLPYIDPMNGMLNFPALLIKYGGLIPSKVHCPGDKYQPGSVATYYKDYYGGMVLTDHHPDLSPESLGVEVVVDYSYLWRRKMYLTLDAQSIVGGGRYDPRSYKITSVPYPSQLIALDCFWTFCADDWWAAYVAGDEKTAKSFLSHGKFGFQAGFLDGHAAYVPAEKVWDRAPDSQDYPPWDVLPNLDWTKKGIFGWDVP